MATPNDGTAKCVGLERRIAVLVQKIHIQDQGQMFVECKSSSTPPQSLIISSIRSSSEEVKKILQGHQWCHKAIQCISFMTTLQYLIQLYT
jgi:hypothetical protein